MRPVEAARAEQRGVEVGGPVGGADDEHVGRRGLGLAQLARAAGRNRLTLSTNQPRDAHRRGSAASKRLELDQQLVDDAGDAFACGRRRPCRSGRRRWRRSPR